MKQSLKTSVAKGVNVSRVQEKLKASSGHAYKLEIGARYYTSLLFRKGISKRKGTSEVFVTGIKIDFRRILWNETYVVSERGTTESVT